MSGAAFSSFVFILLCLQETVQAKSIQHHQQGPTRYDSQDGIRNQQGEMSLLPFNDSGESEEEDGPIWYDSGEDEMVDGCDSEESLLYNPLCQSYESDGFGGNGDMMRIVDKRRLRAGKRRLRFNKRRLRFVKKMHPEYSAKLPVDDVYSRESRKPRLRFVKRDLKKMDALNTHAEESEDKSDTVKHSRKRRSLAGLDQDFSLNKRLSTNQDIKLLADMVIAQVQRRINAERQELRSRLLMAGKRSEPSLRTSDISDGVLSKAFSDVLKSIMGPSR